MTTTELASGGSWIKSTMLSIRPPPAPTTPMVAPTLAHLNAANPERRLIAAVALLVTPAALTAAVVLWATLPAVPVVTDSIAALVSTQAPRKSIPVQGVVISASAPERAPEPAPTPRPTPAVVAPAPRPAPVVKKTPAVVIDRLNQHPRPSRVRGKVVNVPAVWPPEPAKPPAEVKLAAPIREEAPAAAPVAAPEPKPEPASKLDDHEDLKRPPLD